MTRAQNPLQRLGTAITRLTEAQESLAQTDEAEKPDVAQEAHTKGDPEKPSQTAAGSADASESVKKALKDAANAKATHPPTIPWAHPMQC